MKKKAELPSGWVCAPIGQTVAIDGIFTDGDWVETKDQDPDGDVRLIQLADIGDGSFLDKSSRFLTRAKALELNCTFLKKGDLLVARMPEPLGRCCIFPLDGVEKYVTVVDVCAVRPGTSSINSKFLMYAINSLPTRTAIEALKSGSTRKRISRRNLSHVEIPLAPKNEQLRIVARIEELFSKLDMGIKSLKTARAKLDVYRQAVLKDAFEGKLTAQWREENKYKLEIPDKLLARIQQTRLARYEEQLREWKNTIKKWEDDGKRGKKTARPQVANDPSPISRESQERLLDLPYGWKWVKLGQLFSVPPQNGVYKPASHYGSGTQIIRIDDFYDGRLIRRTGFKRLRLSNEEIKKYKVQNSDLLVNRVNSIEHLGKCALVDSLTENTAFESNIMRCRLVEDVISKPYIAAYLASHKGRNQLCENAKHAVNQASINQADVATTLVPITCREEQLRVVQEIEQKLSQADASISQIEVHLKKAGALKQSILRRAFAGHLVLQDPNDEPASVLLDRIRTEREKELQHNSSKKIRKITTSV